MSTSLCVFDQAVRSQEPHPALPPPLNTGTRRPAFPALEVSSGLYSVTFPFFWQVRPWRSCRHIYHWRRRLAAVLALYYAPIYFRRLICLKQVRQTHPRTRMEIDYFSCLAASCFYLLVSSLQMLVRRVISQCLICHRYSQDFIDDAHLHSLRAFCCLPLSGAPQIWLTFCQSFS